MRGFAWCNTIGLARSVKAVRGPASRYIETLRSAAIRNVAARCVEVMRSAAMNVKVARGAIVRNIEIMRGTSRRDCIVNL